MSWKAVVLVAAWGGAGAGVTWVGGQTVWLLFYGLSCLLVYVVLHAAALKSVVAERTVERNTVTAGSRVRVMVSLKLSSWVPLPLLLVWIAVEEPWTLQGTAKNMKRRLFLTGFRSKLRYEYEWTNVKRGVYNSEQVHVYAADLFGLYTKRRSFDAPLSFEVYPRVGAVIYRVPMPALFDGQALRGVRDYVAGDPMKRIHWKVSAVSGSLKTKLLEAEPEGQVLIALDSDYPDELHVDKAVETAASYAKAAQEQRCKVGIDCCGTELRMKLERSSSPNDILRLLCYYTDPALDGHEAAQWLWQLGRTVRNQTRLCFITACLDAERMRVLERLRQCGIQLSVIWIHAEGILNPRMRNQLRWLEQLGCHLDIIRLTPESTIELEGRDTHGA